MKATDIRTSFFIIIVFLLMFFASILSVGIQKFKENWPKYKCNPAAMPFAGYLGYDTMDNFVQCISSIQSGLMGRFLAPIFTMTKFMTELAGNIMTSISSIQSTIFSLKGLMNNMFSDMTGMFVNIIVKFQGLIIKMKDIFAKLAGTMITIVYMMKGISLTGTSMWDGPIGQFTRDFCFSPDTKLILNNGKIKKIKDIQIGDVLENDIDVIATLKIKNQNPEKNPYYKIWSDKLESYIYVTATHKILDTKDGFIPVETYSRATKTDIQPDVLYCLITENHQIPIGEYTFWDWED
tara:strand:+ start:6986 stop:7867 length:882 start_codon:yes stop_codon:yes gene_type:complete